MPVKTENQANLDIMWKMVSLHLNQLLIPYCFFFAYNINYWRTYRHSYTYGTSTYAIYNMTNKTNVS